MQPTHHLQEHIDTIARHEQEFLERRTAAERLGDSIASFVGSLGFVAMHICLFLAWILINKMPSGLIPHFDPPPFSLLATCVAMEGILLSSFILMRQGRLARRSDERDHLMLQILLLTEKEITAVIQINRRVAENLGVQSVAGDEAIEELSQHTSIDEVAQTIQENISPEG
jgi:uncharacterized membrane protein